LNAVSKNVSDLPDDVEENGTQNPHSLKPCVAPNEDENNIANDDLNDPNVCKPVSGHKSKQVCNMGPRRAWSKRNVESDGKRKRNKSTKLHGISDLKFC
jgi:gluconate kinase